MKLIIIVIIALVIASGLAYQVHFDPGYALITYGIWSFETSLAILLFITSIAFFALYFSLRVLMTIKHAPISIGNWNKRRQQTRSKKSLNKGLIDSAEGNWQRSEKLLVKHAMQSETPLLNYLSAAHAAQSQGAYDRRDDYLFKAGEALPEQIHAIHLTRAKLQFSAGQFEQALATLQQLRTATPSHPIVLTLLLKTLVQLNDWKAVYNLLPAIKNNRKIEQDEWLATEHQTLLLLLSDPPHLDEVWKNLNKKQKLNADYVSPYASHLIAQGKSQLAEDLLINGLKHELNPALLSLYAALNIDTNTKIKRLEKWLKSNASSPDLLNTLAELCLKQELWGIAKNYLEKSIALKPSHLAYLLLGQTLEQLESPAKDVENCYRTGLEFLALDGTTAQLTNKQGEPEHV